MQRVTVTVDDNLLALARADVQAGRASSVSAWIADAMRHKALARAELITELDEMTAADPYEDATVEWVAQVLDRPTAWVAERLPVESPRFRRAG